LRTFVIGTLPIGGGGKPQRHGELALAIARDTNNRRQRVRVDARKARKIARRVARDTKKATHGLLVPGNAVEVVHLEREAASV
jgi:hypothetical protein